MCSALSTGKLHLKKGLYKLLSKIDKKYVQKYNKYKEIIKEQKLKNTEKKLGLCLDILKSDTYYKQRMREAVIGKHSYYGPGCFVEPGMVHIGSFCSIADRVALGLTQHPIQFLSSHPFQYMKWENLKNPVHKWTWNAPTSIGNDVWIGHNACVMGGVSIGDGAVIAANAVVTKDVPPYAIVGGVPAKIIRYRFHEQTIADLLELKWWDLPDEAIETLPFSDVQACVKKLKAIRNNVIPIELGGGGA